MKKFFIYFLCLIFGCLFWWVIYKFFICNKVLCGCPAKIWIIEDPLPAQELSEWLRWVYWIDKNINEKTIDNYLHRSDVVYRDVRMLEDSASWENKWGTRNLEWFVEWFEVVPYAYLTQFPQEYIAYTDENNCPIFGVKY